MLNIHRTAWANEYKLAKFPFYDVESTVLYRPTATSVECGHGEEFRPGLQVEFLPSREEAAVLAQGGFLSLFFPDLDTPPEFWVVVGGEKSIRARASEAPREAIARAMYNAQPVRPPLAWDALDDGAKTMWLQRADIAVRMVFQHFAEPLPPEFQGEPAEYGTEPSDDAE